MCGLRATGVGEPGRYSRRGKLGKMGMHIKSKLCWFALAMALGAGTAVAQQAGLVDDSALASAGKNANEWLMNGRDYSEQRYSPLNQIDTSNVSKLGLVWYYDTG